MATCLFSWFVCAAHEIYSACLGATAYLFDDYYYRLIGAC